MYTLVWWVRTYCEKTGRSFYLHYEWSGFCRIWHIQISIKEVQMMITISSSSQLKLLIPMNSSIVAGALRLLKKSGGVRKFWHLTIAHTFFFVLIRVLHSFLSSLLSPLAFLLRFLLLLFFFIFFCRQGNIPPSVAPPTLFYPCILHYLFSLSNWAPVISIFSFFVDPFNLSTSHTTFFLIQHLTSFLFWTVVVNTLPHTNAQHSRHFWEAIVWQSGDQKP